MGLSQALSDSNPLLATSRNSLSAQLSRADKTLLRFRHDGPFGFRHDGASRRNGGNGRRSPARTELKCSGNPGTRDLHGVDVGKCHSTGAARSLDIHSFPKIPGDLGGQPNRCT
jgi:hypothetical protein